MADFMANMGKQIRRIFRKCKAFFGIHGVTIVVQDDVEQGPRYIVVDLEWNQYPKWARTPVSSEGVVMPHEIVQIGAVKVDQHFRPLDTFTVYIRLQGRRKLSKHVARVIQKTQAEIDQGVDFPVAYALFSEWSADAERFVTWGTDDYRVFENNLRYYRMSQLDRDAWYDAQMVYAEQVRGDRVQTALAKAAETLSVEDDLTHHDALNDAFITACVCARLDMQRGMAERERETQPKGIRSKQSESLLFRQKKFVSASSEGGFETRAIAKQHCTTLPVPCPVCTMAMKLEPSRISSGDRWMRMAACKEHGKHLVRYRIRHKADGEFAWTRTIYANDEELERYFREKVTQKQQKKRRRSKPKQHEAKPAQNATL